MNQWSVHHQPRDQPGWPRYLARWVRGNGTSRARSYWAYAFIVYNQLSLVWREVRSSSGKVEFYWVCLTIIERA